MIVIFGITGSLYRARVVPAAVEVEPVFIPVELMLLGA